jgi:hypothetical protein
MRNNILSDLEAQILVFIIPTELPVHDKSRGAIYALNYDC